MSSVDYVTSLPTELLQQCFQYLIDEDIEADPHRRWMVCHEECKPRTRHRTAWALSLTCKLFSQVIQALMYANVELLQQDYWHPAEKTIR
jgi:hypothetical protein